MFVTASIFFVSLLIGCQTTNSKSASGALTIPAGYEPPPHSPVLETRKNALASVSLDGQALLFLSRDRTTHRPSQLYFFDLKNKKEKRITFQDGDVTEGHWHAQGYWIYASNTDEGKERPKFIQESLEKRSGVKDTRANYTDFSGHPLADNEIYRQSTADFQIDRLTESPYFDGQIALRPNSSEMMFVSMRSGLPQVYRQNLSVLHASLVSKPKVETQHPAFSADGREFAFVEKLSSEDYRVQLGKSGSNQTQTIFKQKQPIFDLVFHPQSKDILFVRPALESGLPALFVMAKDGTCERRITYLAAATHSPQWSVDGTELYFTLEQDGESQIFKMKYSPPPCPAATLPLESKK